MVKLVPGRECGDCVACCRVLPIDGPDLKKQAGVLCPNCTQGVGCTIYEHRPELCRGFYCGWRRLAIIPDGWRPDDFGVLIDIVADRLPAGYAGVGLKLLVFGGEEVLLTKEFAEVLSGFVDKRVPVFLGVPGPPGHNPTATFLSEIINPAVASRDLHAVQRVLVKVYRALQAHNATLAGPPDGVPQQPG